MSHLDEWAQLIAKQLKSDAELVGAQAKSELYGDVARESFTRVVLEPFLPASYAFGSGRVIDASGTISSPQDIVIYRKDYPQFNMPGSHDVFIYESVLATIQVSSKLIRKSFFDAMDQCASMGELDPQIEPATRRALALKMEMKADANQQFIHPDPLNTHRFDLIGRPQSFIYAFSGYQTSEKQLADNIDKWIDHYHQDHEALHMKSLPSVIATQGCFAWRNTVPFTIKNPVLMGIGNDHAPLRLIILQLMHALNRRLQNTSDGYGIRSNITPYLAQFEPPAISATVGTALNPGGQKPVPANKPEAKPVVAEKQMPSATPSQPLQPQPAVVEATQPAPVPNTSPEPVAATPGTNVSPESSVAAAAALAEVEAERAVQSANTPVTSPVHEESETPAPVIEDRSRPKQPRADTSPGQPSEAGSRAKPSPLSLYGSEGEEDVEEYQFSPIEPPAVSQPEEEDASTAQAAAEDSLEATQEIDLSKFNKSEASNADQQSEPVSRPATQDSARDDGVNEAFMDTLVEESETLAQKKSEPTPPRSKYVTESLLQ